MWVPLPGSGARGWGSQHGVGPQASQGTPVAEISLLNLSATARGSGAGPFHASALSTGLNAASSVNPRL